MKNGIYGYDKYDGKYYGKYLKYKIKYINLKNIKIGGSATTKIKRKDFGLIWNAALEAGGVLVGDDVAISLEVQFVKKA